MKSGGRCCSRMKKKTFGTLWKTMHYLPFSRTQILLPTYALICTHTWHAKNIHTNSLAHTMIETWSRNIHPAEPVLPNGMKCQKKTFGTLFKTMHYRHLHAHKYLHLHTHSYLHIPDTQNTCTQSRAQTQWLKHGPFVVIKDTCWRHWCWPDGLQTITDA